MKRLLKFLTGRMFWSIIIISFEVALILYAVWRGAMRWSHLANIFYLFTLVMVVFLTTRDDNPTYKIGWLLILFLLPLYGGVLYLLGGNKRMIPKIRLLRDRMLAPYLSGMQNVHPLPEPETGEQDAMLSRMQHHISSAGGGRLYDHTDATFFSTGDEWFLSLTAQLEKAQSFILIEIFIIDHGEVWSRVLDILTRKASEGVEVRLLYDDVGTIKFLSRHYPKFLESKGLKVSVFNPLKPHINARMNCRDHRKVIVIDGNVGYTGGVNLADEYANRKILYGHWKDYAIRLKGDAVASLTLMFMKLWAITSGEHLDFSRFMPTVRCKGEGLVQPFEDTPLDQVNVSEESYLQIINTAREYVWISTPYLVLDNEMITALKLAARSGVEVRILVPHIPDKPYVFAVNRYHYKALVSNGMEIYEYIPGFVHAKTIISDDKVGIVGTINMDFRTFYLNFENGVAFYHSPVIKEIKRDMETSFFRSLAVTMKQIHQTPLIIRLFRTICFFFSPLL